MANSPYQLGPISNVYGAPADTGQHNYMSNTDYTNKVLNVLGRQNIHPIAPQDQRPEIIPDPQYGAGITSPEDAAYSKWGASQPMYNKDNPYYTESENTFTPSQFGGTANVPWFSPAAGSGTQGSDYDTGVTYATAEDAIAAGDYWAAYRKDHAKWRAENPNAGMFDYPGNKDLGIHSDSDQLEDMTGKSLLDYRKEHIIDEIKDKYEDVTDYISDAYEPVEEYVTDAYENVTDWAGDAWDATTDWWDNIWEP